MTGRVIGHYRLIDKLGEGGMGKVYRAIDTMVEREVAMKSLKPELASRPDVLERFRSEATLLAKLNHPNIAQLYSFFKDGNEFFMVMEYVPGKTLEKLIQERGALPWRRAVEIAAQMLDGIQHAHTLGVLHRDVKPANIIFTEEAKAATGGLQPSVKVTDFGIAQALGGSRMTREGHLIGTLEYLAPERIQGKGADARSDLYSVAIVLYEMLTGKLPFQADSEYSLLLAQVQQLPPRPREWVADLPPAVEQTLLRALEKDPARRFPDAASFSAELRQQLAPPEQVSPSANAALYQIEQFIAPFAGLMKGMTPPSDFFRQFGAALSNAWRDQTFRVVLLCGVALLCTLSVLVIAIIQKKPSGEAPAIAETFEPEPQTRATPSVPINETPILPGTPIPIDRILGNESGAPAPTSPGEPLPGGGIGTIGPVPLSPSVLPPGPSAPVNRTNPTSRPAVSIVPRETVIAALDITDGPTEGQPGEWPVHRAGLIGALRVSAGQWLPDINQELRRRGVNFLLTPSMEHALRQAGADNAIISTVTDSLRSVPNASPPNESASAASKTTPPAPEAPPRSITRLRDVRKLYVENMEGDLDQLLRAEIAKEIGSRIAITKTASSADARMTASLDEEKGGFMSGAGRVFGLKDKYRLTVRILAAGTSRELWRHETGDKSPIVGAFGSNAINRVVSRIVDQLRDDFN